MDIVQVITKYWATRSDVVACKAELISLEKDLNNQWLDILDDLRKDTNNAHGERVVVMMLDGVPVTVEINTRSSVPTIKRAEIILTGKNVDD